MLVQNRDLQLKKILLHKIIYEIDKGWMQHHGERKDYLIKDVISY